MGNMILWTDYKISDLGLFALFTGFWGEGMVGIPRVVVFATGAVGFMTTITIDIYRYF